MDESGSFNAGSLNSIGGLNNIYSAVRENSVSHLLLDGGDFLGKGDFEDHSLMITMMNKTGYHAATPGDKELANGQDYLATLLPLMNFKLVNCNYEFSNPVLKTNILKFYTMQHNGYKIGITGVGPRIPAASSAGIECHHPYKIATGVATFLKKELNCDLVVCLSHLGLEQENEGPGQHDVCRIFKKYRCDNWRSQ
jgi:5'-nucleotidase